MPVKRKISRSGMNDLRADLGIVNEFQGIKKRRAPKKIDGIGSASDSVISDNEDD